MLDEELQRWNSFQNCDNLGNGLALQPSFRHRLAPEQMLQNMLCLDAIHQ